MKFLELARYCEKIDIDCDRCDHQKECAKFAEYLEEASPIAIVGMVENNLDL